MTQTNRPPRDTVVFDFETDGINFNSSNPADGQWPVTVAAIRYDADGQEKQRFYCAIRPGAEGTPNWSAQAEKTHGITRAELDQAVIIQRELITPATDTTPAVYKETEVPVLHAADALQGLQTLLGLDERPRPEWVIQNAPFDMAFLNRLRQVVGLPALPLEGVYCTKAIGSDVLPIGESKRLQAMAPKYLGHEQGATHNADRDVELANGMFRYFRAHYPEAVKPLDVMLEELLRGCSAVTDIVWQPEHSTLSVSLDACQPEMAARLREALTKEVSLPSKYPNGRPYTIKDDCVVADHGDHLVISLNKLNRGFEHIKADIAAMRLDAPLLDVRQAEDCRRQPQQGASLAA